MRGQAELVPVKIAVIFSWIFIFSKNAVAENCDKQGLLLYEDLGCKPLFDKSNTNNPCPSRFDCLGLKKSNNCYFKGKTYKLEEQVDSRLTVPSCDLGCSCEKVKDRMKFKCAALDCPEWSGKPSKPGCYKKYSLDACCSIRETCPPFDNSTTCIYDGHVFKEGENFLPKDSCWRCVCQAGFRGKIEKPFCRRRSCGSQIKYQEKLQERCAPLYYKRAYREVDPLCCPAMWVCSDGNEKLLGRPKSDKKCQFGYRILRVGQHFEKNITMSRNMSISCECKIPPLLTCTTVVI